jgi:CRP-like cAMP-binding protein
MSTAQFLIQRQHSNLNAIKNADRLWHLQKTGLADNFSLRELHFLASACTDLILEKNQIIYQQGDRADGLFLVNRGTVRLSTSNLGGKEKVAGFLGIGRVFGEEILGKNSHRRSRAVAHEESWISFLSEKSLTKVCEQIPALNLNLLKILDCCLQEARDEIETLSFGGTEKRIASVLLKLSSHHGKSVVSPPSFKKLRILVSHENLAQMIGANRPHVSSIMSQFKRNGVIQYQGRKLLINEESLSSILDQ